MRGFVRGRPRNHPADWTIPDRMHDARARSVLAINGCHCAIDRLTHTRQEFCLQVLKSRNVHWSELLSRRANAVGRVGAIQITGRPTDDGDESAAFLRTITRAILSHLACDTILPAHTFRAGRVAQLA